MDNETESTPFSLNKLPRSLRFIIKSFAFAAHHKHLRPPPLDNLDFSTLPQFIVSVCRSIPFIIYIGSYIGLLFLLVRVTGLILTETFSYFNREGWNLASLIQYLRYGLDK